MQTEGCADLHADGAALTTTPYVRVTLPSDVKRVCRGLVELPLRVELHLGGRADPFRMSNLAVVHRVALDAAVSAATGRKQTGTLLRGLYRGVFVVDADSRQDGMLHVHALCFELAGMKDNGPCRKRGRGE